MINLPQPTNTYVPATGSFGVLRYKDLEWHACREVIQSRFLDGGENDGRCYFCFSSATLLREFVNAIEKHLEIPLSEIDYTNRKNVVGIVPSPFWKGTPIFFSFFTIVLRASALYERGNDPLTVLRSQRYAEQTKDAVDRFLSGHKHYNGNHRYTQWVDTFSRASRKETEKWLSDHSQSFSRIRYIWGWISWVLR